MSPVCGIRVEQEKACPETSRPVGGGEGASQAVQSREGLSTVAVARWRTGL